ncbi:hypothetical protein TVAG_412440 [Trichomonas vaginalis G3]|uniref:E2F/DP family winged-helix DNA-binding domain-containing protein n=1 Tax=Trichomonas vaginalis (strain ATCC PRA-98 / G3) TaxID=412133 RepID=A2EV57_TRIV3|nr:winged helix DNA-binding domain family [Trichomonas vaginalis G3]EAY03440.1 hypothetical protein TVAG_412440 [Trichomonas vaginalis G3]KAI5486169.1 winged helix DNA-binding domain family [Trichomonas vaginalis G3]|eukprot:XP_001315663.1 hypothetical protein [Trichomonas vaginalis G3]
MHSEPDSDFNSPVQDHNVCGQTNSTTDKPNNFKSSTYEFIHYCNDHKDQKYDIKSISNKMGFRQRRFFEVVAVFEALGVCPKIDQDSFLWIGFENIKHTIERIATSRGAFLPEFSLDSIFSYKGCISVQKVTEEFILLFIALELRKINLIEAAAYLARSNEREKTIKCKLYQVAAVLEIANIIRKTDKPSEFELLPEYFISASEKMSPKTPDPSILYSLLSRPEPFCPDVGIPVISSRLNEYYSNNF